MSDNNNNAYSSGLSLSSVLGIVFIVLKLTGLINWSWVWVLSPFWIPVGIVAAFLLIFGVVALAAVVLAGLETKKRLKKEMRREL